MRIHLLDPGNRMYGDAILLEMDGKTVLIDGNHPGDDKPGRATPSVQDQIAACLDTTLPVVIDLLVVTHCHSDHIGCLPELVMGGILKPRFALVADEAMGFGRRAEDGTADLSMDAVVNRVAAALREEPHGGTRSDADLADFLSDAATVEPRYLALLDYLERTDVPVARYGRDANPSALIKKAGIKGLKILGPTDEQLLLCAEAIRGFTKKAVDAVTALRLQDSALSDVELYKMLAGQASSPDLMDSPGKGAALNDQSILLVASEGKYKCLLTGDMQFAAPEVSKVNLREAAASRLV